MPRKPDTNVLDADTVPAEDFLESLDDDDTPIFLEGDEKVTEADIARELGIEMPVEETATAVEPAPAKRGPGRPRKNPLPVSAPVAKPTDAVGEPEDDILAELSAPLPSPTHDSKTLYEVSRLVSSISSDVEALTKSQKTVASSVAEALAAVNEVRSGINTDLHNILTAVHTTLNTLTTLVTQVHQQVHAAPPKAVAVAAPVVVEKVPAPEPEKTVAASSTVVSDYIEKEVRVIVSSIPKGSRPLPVSQLAEVICKKRFSSDPKALAETLHVLRNRLSDLGSITQDDQFHRL